MKRLIIILFVAIALTGCKTAPAVINETQTEIISSVKELEGSITVIKEITDKAKETGEINKSDVNTVIKYVDKSADEVKTLNSLIENQTGYIANIEQQNIDYKVNEQKLKKWLYLSIAGNVILTALILLYLIKKI